MTRILKECMNSGEQFLNQCVFCEGRRGAHNRDYFYQNAAVSYLLSECSYFSKVPGRSYVGLS